MLSKLAYYIKILKKCRLDPKRHGGRIHKKSYRRCQKNQCFKVPTSTEHHHKCHKKHGTLSLKYCKDFKINIKNLISCHFFELMSAKYMVVCLGCRTSDLGWLFSWTHARFFYYYFGLSFSQDLKGIYNA